MLAGWRDGAVKLLVVARLLDLRARRPHLFARGGDVPLTARGRQAAHVVAFARVEPGARLVVVVPRLPARLYRAAHPLRRAARWDDTALDVGALRGPRRWRDVLTGTELNVESRRGATVRVAAALASFPVAVLMPAADTA